MIMVSYSGYVLYYRCSNNMNAKIENTIIRKIYYFSYYFCSSTKLTRKLYFKINNITHENNWF